MHGVPDSGPTPDPLSLCQDDINLIVTCFNAAINIALKRIFVFTARRNARIASAVLATAIPSVRLCVRPSHAGIVSKRRHVARCSLHRWIPKCV